MIPTDEELKQIRERVDAPWEPFSVFIANALQDVPRLLDSVEELKRLLRQCAVAVCEISGDTEHDDTQIAEHMKTSIEDIPRLVSDQYTDLQCRVAQMEGYIQLILKTEDQVNQLRSVLNEVRTSIQDRKKRDRENERLKKEGCEMKGYIELILKTESAEVLERLLRSFCDNRTHIATVDPDGLFTEDQINQLRGVLNEVRTSIQDRKKRDRESMWSL